MRSARIAPAAPESDRTLARVVARGWVRLRQRVGAGRAEAVIHVVRRARIGVGRDQHAPQRIVGMARPLRRASQDELGATLLQPTSVGVILSDRADQTSVEALGVMVRPS
jgi:hypothetical protein